MRPVGIRREKPYASPNFWVSRGLASGAIGGVLAKPVRKINRQRRDFIAESVFNLGIFEGCIDGSTA